MVAIYRTSEFRELAQEKRKELPETTRRKASRAPRWVPGSPRHDEAAPWMQEYMKEAYNAVRCIALLYHSCMSVTLTCVGLAQPHQYAHSDASKHSKTISGY